MLAIFIENSIPDPSVFKEVREVINLKYFRDFKFEEIATFQDISINTALGRSRYALQNLRNFMAV